MNKKELYQIFFDWTTDARTRFPDRPVPEPIQLAQYVTNPDLDTDSNYPGLVEWASVLRHIRSLYEAGELRPGQAFTEAHFDASAKPAPAAEKEPKKPLSDAMKLRRKSKPTRRTEPEQEPKPEPERPEVRRQATRSFSTDQLVEIDPWSIDSEEPCGKIRVTQDGEQLNVQWSMPRGGTRIYRIYSSETPWPDILDPDALREITTGTSFVDDEPLYTAARFYQVWVHTGATEEEAKQTQPRLLGQTYFIEPVEIKNPVYDGAHISAQWSGLDGTEKVEVYRSIKPRGKLDVSANVVNQEGNRSGVRFVPQERGYTYRIAAKRFVLVDGNLVGSALSEEVTVEVGAELEDIFATTEQISPRTVHVSWPAPLSGTVRIYRTESRIEDGADKQRTLDLELLDQYGLPEQAWVNSTSTDKNEFDVTWPDDWYTMHITAVSVVGGHARIGNSVPFTRVGEIENPRLLERVDEQVLSFGWPKHASSVHVFIGEPNGAHETEYQPTASKTVISAEDFKKTGNLPLNLHRTQTQAGAASLALYPQRMQEGKAIVGDPAVVDYPGLEKYSYDLALDRGEIFLQIHSHQPHDAFQENNPHFVLVHCSGRLPLSQSDGQFVSLTMRMDPNQPVGASEGETSISPRFDENGNSQWYKLDPSLWQRFTFHEDFIRLFLQQEHRPEHMPRRALLDPHPRKLSLVEFLPQNQPQPAPTPAPQPEPEKKSLFKRMFGK